MSSKPAEGARASRPRLPEILAASLLGALWLGVSLVPLAALPRTVDDAPGLDAHIYIAMSEAPSVFTMPPFGYRIGVPLLVHWLPLSTEAAFFFVTSASLLACFVLAYLFLRELGFEHGMSLLGASFVAAAPEVSRYLQNYFLVDPAALAFVTAFLLGVERKWSLGRLALLLLLGCLVKENVLIVTTVLYLTRSERRLFDRRAAAQTLLVAAPALAAMLLLRFHWGGTAAVGFPYLSPWSVPRTAWFGSMRSYHDIWQNLFGYLALLAVANAITGRWRGFAIRYFPFFLLVVAQLIVPRNEERLLYFAFPVVIPLALEEFRRLHGGLSGWFPLIASLLVFCYLFAPGQLVVPLGLVLFGRVLLERAP